MGANLPRHRPAAAQESAQRSDSLDIEELPFDATGRALRARLPGSAPSIADGVIGMLAERPRSGEPRTITTVHVRLTRTVVVAETTLALDSERQVYA